MSFRSKSSLQWVCRFHFPIECFIPYTKTRFLMLLSWIEIGCLTVKGLEQSVRRGVGQLASHACTPSVNFPHTNPPDHYYHIQDGGLIRKCIKKRTADKNISFNPLTPGTFCKQCVFWTFWRFLGWISAKLP